MSFIKGLYSVSYDLSTEPAPVGPELTWTGANLGPIGAGQYRLSNSLCRSGAGWFRSGVAERTQETLYIRFKIK